MERENEYFTLQGEKGQQRTSWNSNRSQQSNWPNAMTPWQAEMPIWQYTAAALTHDDTPMAYYPTEAPISPTYTNPSSVHSTLNSPTNATFMRDARFASQPLTPMYDNSGKPPTINHQQVKEEEAVVDDDEDSDTYPWQPKPGVLKPVRPPHRRSHSANELSVKNAKRAHTVVEKNYRERLNDKINDLALYLFETSSDSRTKPSKSLVMTRAKERLKQLESRNKSLEDEVVKLRQHIAILDHVVATGGNHGAASNGNLNISGEREVVAC